MAARPAVVDRMRKLKTVSPTSNVFESGNDEKQLRVERRLVVSKEQQERNKVVTGNQAPYHEGMCLCYEHVFALLGCEFGRWVNRLDG